MPNERLIVKWPNSKFRTISPISVAVIVATPGENVEGKVKEAQQASGLQDKGV